MVMDVSVSVSLLPRADDGPLIIASPVTGPHTTPSLTANLVLRVFLALLSNLVCLVPLRLLHRNGEFAAVVFILTVELKNIMTVVNSLVWRNDDVESWYPGYGFCDMSSFVDNFTSGVFAMCLLAIMRNLAQQVGLMRANAMTAGEKRQRNLIQALIIFPLPFVMLGMTWPLAAQRYAVGTLVGCLWVAHPSWPYLLTFVLPHILMPLVTAAYAVLTYLRYREIVKTTQSALSRNRVASNRAQRTRRRLYLMVLSIMVPFLPLQIVLFVNNVRAVHGLVPYDYDAIHNQASPYPWNSIVYLTSAQLPWALINISYLAIIIAVPIFAFFGMTTDAMNDYRRVLLFFGLAKVFPRLRNEYDPDRHVRVTDVDISFGSTAVGSDNTNTTCRTRASKLKSIIYHPLCTLTSTTATITARRRSSSFHPMPDLEQGPSGTTVVQPPPPAHRRDTSTSTRRLLLARTSFLFPSFQVPFFQRADEQSDIPLDDLPPSHQQPSGPLPHVQDNYQDHHWAADSTGIRTRVWSEEERHLTAQGDRHSVSSVEGSGGGSGVVVETHFTRETETNETETGNGDGDGDQQQR